MTRLFFIVLDEPSYQVLHKTFTPKAVRWGVCGHRQVNVSSTHQHRHIRESGRAQEACSARPLYAQEYDFENERLPIWETSTRVKVANAVRGLRFFSNRVPSELICWSRNFLGTRIYCRDVYAIIEGPGRPRQLVRQSRQRVISPSSNK